MGDHLMILNIYVDGNCLNFYRYIDKMSSSNHISKKYKIEKHKNCLNLHIILSPF